MSTARKTGDAAATGGRQDDQVAADKPVTPGDVDSLEKVRDILFGSQVREQERRLNRFEERFLQEVAALRDEANRRFESLEAYVKKELEAVHAGVAAEKRERGEAVEAVARDLGEASRSLDGRLREAQDAAGSAERSLRDQILQQSKELSEELRRRTAELKKAYEADVRLLQSAKPDRAALAGLFNELAVRLSDETGDAGDDG